MKIFFTGSPRALTSHNESLVKIYKIVEELGYHHLSDFVISPKWKDFYTYDEKQLTAHFNKMIDALKKADVVLVEGSVHSMSMGYLVEKALSQNKPVIVLHQLKQPILFISGISDKKLQIVEYNSENINSVLKKALEYAINQQEVRFNFFISPNIGRYLDWISKVKKIPRSVYLRALIERDMRENTEFEDSN